MSELEDAVRRKMEAQIAIQSQERAQEDAQMLEERRRFFQNQQMGSAFPQYGVPRYGMGGRGFGYGGGGGGYASAQKLLFAHGLRMQQMLQQQQITQENEQYKQQLSQQETERERRRLEGLLDSIDGMDGLPPEPRKGDKNQLRGELMGLDPEPLPFRTQDEGTGRFYPDDYEVEEKRGKEIMTRIAIFPDGTIKTLMDGEKLGQDLTAEKKAERDHELELTKHKETVRKNKFDSGAGLPFRFTKKGDDTKTQWIGKEDKGKITQESRRKIINRRAYEAMEEDKEKHDHEFGGTFNSKDSLERHKARFENELDTQIDAGAGDLQDEYHRLNRQGHDEKFSYDPVESPVMEPMQQPIEEQFAQQPPEPFDYDPLDDSYSLGALV